MMMTCRRCWLAIAVAAVIVPEVIPAAAAPPDKIPDVPAYLQEVSVTIQAGRSEGSGVAVIRDGVTYIWTAAHVVAGLRSTRMVVDPRTGSKKTVVEFGDAQVVKILLEEGRIVGRLAIDAEVLKYSDAQHGQDLALLRVRKRGFIGRSARFYLDPKLPRLGCPLTHCGSLLGSPGAGSITTGVLSQTGRVLSGSKVIYDQVTVVAFPGSSGGAVTLEDGRVMGILVRGTSVQGFNLVVPARRMIKWARSAGVYWAIDPAEKMPAAEVLGKLPIEDTLPGGGSGKPAGKLYPFLIRTSQRASTTESVMP